MNESDEIKVSYVKETFGINYEDIFTPTGNDPIIALYNIVGRSKNDRYNNPYIKYYDDNESDNDIKNNSWLYSVVLVDTAKNKIYPFTGVEHQYMTHIHPVRIPFLKQKQINFIQSNNTNFYYLDISEENNKRNMGEFICLEKNSENIVLQKHIILFSYEINDGIFAQIQSTSYKFNISDQIFVANNNSRTTTTAKLSSIDGEEVSTQCNLFWVSNENQQSSVKNCKIISKFLEGESSEKVYYTIDHNIILIQDFSKFYLLNKEDKELQITECKIAEELLKEDLELLKYYKINNQSILIRDRVNRFYLLSQEDNELILKEGINLDNGYRALINENRMIHRAFLDNKPLEEYISYFNSKEKYLESIFNAVNNIPNCDSKERRMESTFNACIPNPINKETLQVTNTSISATLVIINCSLITTSILSYQKQVKVTTATVLFASELIITISILAAAYFIYNYQRNCDTSLSDVKSNPITPNDESISHSSRNCGLPYH